MGPLISRMQLMKVKKYVASAREDRAQLILGDNQPADPKLSQGNYFEPTIFANVDPSMKIAQSEFNYQTPITGFKQSGLGSEYGRDFLEQYAQRKSVLISLDREPDRIDSSINEAS